MTTIYQRLHALAIELPEAPPPVVAGYVPSFSSHTRSGDTLYISGRLAKRNGLVWVGKLAEQLTMEQGKEAARRTAIEIVSVLHAALGDLNKVKRIVRLFVMVNSTPEFTEPHSVANGASELFVSVFGEAALTQEAYVESPNYPLGHVWKSMRS